MGVTTFSGLMLGTAPGEVMTPRSTSQRLVAEACARVDDGPARIADVGTGSGALAIAMAHACPRADVWATDVDSRAVALARANVARVGLGDRVAVRRGDLLERVPAPVDLIVANLPYLAEARAADYPDLSSEPFDAVFAAGDGLEPYRRLAATAATKLAPTGTLLLQLYGEVRIVEFEEIPALREALGDHRQPAALAA